MTEDSKSLDRMAQSFSVQYKKGWGAPPQYEGGWQPLYDAKIEQITENINATPSEAVFWLPKERWDSPVDLLQGDKIRIVAENDVILFEGFLTKILRQFSGGDEKGGKYERLAYSCLDVRWLMLVGTPVFGQIGRTADDYENFGEPGQAPVDGSYTFFSGRRCIFNPKGIPNCDPLPLILATEDEPNPFVPSMPIFANPSKTESDADKWMCYDMAHYALCLLDNYALKHLSLDFLKFSALLQSEDWQKCLSDISIEGLNSATALQLICKQIGWAFRLDFEIGVPQLVFFKAGSAGDGARSDSNPTVKQALFAPAPADSTVDTGQKDIKAAVEAGKKILWSMQYDQDITNIVNAPLYFGAPQKCEFTAELVPAWLDADLVPDENHANIFLSEAELAEEDNPNSFSFFRYYHARGSDFKHRVGRLWALNESGRYTKPTTYDRGAPFDLATVLPPDFGFDKDGFRLNGPFNREFLLSLACLSKDKQADNKDSIGILVEFSFDEGANWHKIPATILNVDGQCAINITEPNLSEIKTKFDDTITGDALDGVELNYWTSLCDDKLEGRSFKLNEWHTRVRVTASIQLDQRLGGQLNPLNSGSPFFQSDIWDFSNEYFSYKQDDSSVFKKNTELVADERDDYKEFKEYVTKLRAALQDTSISGQFTLERLWPGTFKIGDCITNIEGRGHKLNAGIGPQALYPEIVQIVYMVQKQKTKLVTRDLRYGERLAKTI